MKCWLFLATVFHPARLQELLPCALPSLLASSLPSGVEIFELLP